MIGQTKKKFKGLPLVITFHPLFKDFGNIIHKNLYLLYMHQEAQRAFTPEPMITFRSARKLISYLVRAKLYPLEWTVSSCNVNDMKFVKMLQKHRSLLAPRLKMHTK